MPHASSSDERSRRRRAIVGRVARIALATQVCAYTTGLAALFALWWSLPETDGAYGQTFAQFATGPLTQPMAFWLSTLGGAFAALPACWMLWRTDLARSIPLVLGVTPASVLALGLLGLGQIAWNFGVCAALAAMVVARDLYPRRSEAPA